MATSGSFNYSRTAAQVIQAAYEDLGVYAAGATISSADSTLALARLNTLTKRLLVQSDLSPGLQVYSRKRVVLWLAKGQQTYLVGPGSSDARCATNFGRTTISAAEAAGQTTLSVTATTDTTTDPGTTVTMTASDIIGIEQNDGTIFWTTISSTGAGTVTVASGLDAAAAAGNYVWWFTSRAQRLPIVESAVLRDENRNDTALAIYREARQYDVGVASKYADGDATAILVEPLLTNTRITLNSQPTDVTKQIVLTALYPTEDYDATTDDIAFPAEAYDYLQMALAKRLAPAKGRPWTPEMQSNLNDALLAWRGMNPEVSDLYFQCDA